MTDIRQAYRRENGVAVIEVELSRVEQLFNSLDPSPFHEKDLDVDAEAYLVSSVREFSLKEKLKLVVHLPHEQMGHAARVDLTGAVHHYFAYRAEAARREWRFQLRQGRLALAIGVSFLIGCIALREFLFTPATTTLAQVMAEGLIICGWVAMWRPIQIFLYDWWPLRRQALVYAKLSALPVEARARDTARVAP